MKKRFNLCRIILTAFILAAPSLYAEESENLFLKNFSIDCQLSGGIITGTTTEKVYYPDKTLESQLDWKSYCTPELSLSGRFDIFHGILDISLLSAIPVKNGIMEDFDYLNPDDYSRLSNYSISNLEVTKHFELEAKTGYQFHIKDFTILPEAGFHYMTQGFAAYDGYLQYGSYSEDGFWNSSLTKIKVDGKSVTYEQEYLMPFVSLEAGCSFLKDFNVKLYGRYYPYIKCDSLDMHNARSTRFKDYMDDGTGFAFGTEIRFKRISLCVNYERTVCDSGYTKSKGFALNSTESRASTIPGAETSLVYISASYHF